jgi:hypothetical protein
MCITIGSGSDHSYHIMFCDIAQIHCPKLHYFKGHIYPQLSGSVQAYVLPQAITYFGPLPHLKVVELFQNFATINHIQVQETVTKVFHSKPKYRVLKFAVSQICCFILLCYCAVCGDNSKC